MSKGMKIRVIIRVRVVALGDAGRTICNTFKQIPCRIIGHRSEIKVTAGRLALKCARCGWESPGWTLNRFRAADNPPTHA